MSFQSIFGVAYLITLQIQTKILRPHHEPQCKIFPDCFTQDVTRVHKSDPLAIFCWWTVVTCRFEKLLFLEVPSFRRKCGQLKSMFSLKAYDRFESISFTGTFLKSKLPSWIRFVRFAPCCLSEVSSGAWRSQCETFHYSSQWAWNGYVNWIHMFAW